MDENCYQEKDVQDAILSIPTLPKGIKSVSELLSSILTIAASSYHATQFRSLLQSLLDLAMSLLRKRIEVSEDSENFLKFDKYFDSHPPFQIEKEILAGSWTEGLFLFHQNLHCLPDMDFMCILKNISFSEKDQINAGNLTLMKDTPFVNVHMSEKNLQLFWEEFSEVCPQDETKLRLSSEKLKKRLYRNYKNVGQLIGNKATIHERCEPVGDGPSLKVGMEPTLSPDQVPNPLISCDIVLSISCEGWPHNAHEWLERDRLWPNKDVIRKISEAGFHVVAKSSHEGNFRLSFSVAERTLIGNLNALQHKVARAFKAIIKYHQNYSWSPNVKRIISSYHVKTLLLWHFEKFTEDSWAEDNVVSHLFLLLDEFAHALRTAYLPMYFLPKYNLLCNVDDLEEIKKISDKVMELSSDVPAIISPIYDLGHIRLIADMPTLIGITTCLKTNLRFKLERKRRDMANFLGRDGEGNRADDQLNSTEDKTHGKMRTQCFNLFPHLMNFLFAFLQDDEQLFDKICVASLEQIVKVKR